MRVQAKIHFEDGPTSPIIIEKATEGISQQFAIRLMGQPMGNAFAIAKFLLSVKTKANVSDSYRENLIFTFCALSNHIGKSFIDFLVHHPRELFISDNNPGFISGQARMRSKNEVRYPFTS